MQTGITGVRHKNQLVGKMMVSGHPHKNLPHYEDFLGEDKE